MNILVIDDEPVIREGIKRTLKTSFPQFSLYLASRPEEAVTLLRKHHIHIALTDILMPGMTGLELMSISRSRHRHVKWVVISAHSEFAYAQEAVRLGAKDYLLKPIGEEVLIEMIARLSEEIAREREVSEELQLLKTNLKLLREAVFHRWAMGLDIGSIDIKSFMEKFPFFHLVMVKLQCDKVMQLEHFIVENVLSELIDKRGEGLVTIYDTASLLDLVKPHDGQDILQLIEELRTHLLRYLRIPFQIVHSDLISDYKDVPKHVERMRQASDAQVFEHYANGGERAVEVALQHIHTHYHMDLSLEKVASIVYLHPVYFSQLFKQKMGVGFKEYVIQLRMEQAKKLLLNPKLKIADIANRVGYQDMRHFTQIFRKKFAVTPTEFRQANHIGDAEECRT